MSYCAFPFTCILVSCLYQLALSRMYLAILSSKLNNRCLLLLLLLPPTTLQAFALCLGWQQCKVNRMNKTYQNQSPLPWEMSSCQYSLMGKHRAFPKGQTVYCVALTKYIVRPVGFFVHHKYRNSYLTQTYLNVMFLHVSETLGTFWRM